jgi:hypothetical protein
VSWTDADQGSFDEDDEAFDEDEIEESLPAEDDAEVEDRKQDLRDAGAEYAAAKAALERFDRRGKWRAELPARVEDAAGGSANTLGEPRRELAQAREREQDLVGSRVALVVDLDSARDELERAKRKLRGARDRREHRRAVRARQRKQRDALARERARRARRQRTIRLALLVTLAAVSTVATFVIWLMWIADVDTQAMQAGDKPDWWGGISLLFLAAPAAVAIAAHDRRRRRQPWSIAGAVLLAPVVAAACAYGIKDERAWQKQAKQLFAAFTHRFPAGRLHDLDVREQYQSAMTVCGVDGTGEIWSFTSEKFCIEVVMNRPHGRQVIGGYRYSDDYYNKRACFGDDRDLCSEDGRH